MAILQNDIRNFGKLILGPYIVEFCRWIHEKKAEQSGAQLLFVARDGYLIHQVYDILYPEEISFSRYVPASRSAIRFASMKDRDGIMETLKSVRHKGSVQDALAVQFHLSDGEEETLAAPLAGPISQDQLQTSLLTEEGRKSLAQIVAELSPQIAAKAQNHLEQYTCYLNSIVGNANAFVVDIGYQGTTQRFFSKLINRSVAGLYLITHESARNLAANVGPAFGFDGNFLPAKSSKSLINSYRYFFEAILSAPHGSFLHFSHDGHPVYERQGKDEISSHIRDEIHEGVKLFARQFVSGKSADTSLRESLARLSQFLQNPDAADASLFSGLKFQDPFMGAKDLFIIIPEEFRNSSFSLWPEGQISIDKMHEEKRNFLFSAYLRLENFFLRQYLSRAHYSCYMTNRSLYIKNVIKP